MFAAVIASFRRFASVVSVLWLACGRIVPSRYWLHGSKMTFSRIALYLPLTVSRDAAVKSFASSSFKPSQSAVFTSSIGPATHAYLPWCGSLVFGYSSLARTPFALYAASTVAIAGSIALSGASVYTGYADSL